MSKIIWLLLDWIRISPWIEMHLDGALKHDGWYKSYFQKSPVDRLGNPLPWNPYPYIRFIQGRLTKSMEILEYGSGNSTLFYAKYVKEVSSVEHDQNWYEKMLLLAPSNCQLTLANEEEYVSAATRKFQSVFDLIIVDGIFRNECIIEAIKILSPEGVIILDNAERQEYQPGIDHLKNNGFKELSFEGLVPGRIRNSRTNLYYRIRNCLGL